MTKPLSNYERIWKTVKRVPKGRVATYGLIARAAGLPGHARQVGYALHSLPENSRVPWHRIINAKGEISLRGWNEADMHQRALLEAEGVEFNAAGRVSLEKFLWRPKV